MSSHLKGRGTSWLIESRYQTEHRIHDPSEVEHDDFLGVPGRPSVPTQVHAQSVKSIVARNDSADIGFDASINPYRGCEHGCIYCYARPTHAYLDWSPGLAFETHIVAKVNAAERLKQTFDAKGYQPQPLMLGSVTDVYQPVERRLKITRQVLEVLDAYQHAFSVITKSSLIERDIELLQSMAQRQQVSAVVSVTTLDSRLSRLMEPRASAPHRRLQTIERLAQAGIPVGVSVSPLIPFINEPELEKILAAASQAGASFAFGVVVRLPWEVAPLFKQWLADHFPDRADRVMARVRDMRGGKDNDARFGVRMKGEGVWADLLQSRLKMAMQRHGLSARHPPLDLTRFKRPEQSHQPSLF